MVEEHGAGKQYVRMRHSRNGGHGSGIIAFVLGGLALAAAIGGGHVAAVALAAGAISLLGVVVIDSGRAQRVAVAALAICSRSTDA